MVDRGVQLVTMLGTNTAVKVTGLVGGGVSENGMVNEPG